jgi:hypothetical protein
MTNKTIIRISLSGLIAFVCVGFFLTAFNSATTSETKTCKESMDECCKKSGEKKAGAEIDFETLSGKFFSSSSY